ncbi:transglutaminase-like domain-containing protein [Fibrella aquatica]|uniref:transglutaminase-like domain-containing protein n=1 Tax=Fibrella aquatica TaxID=3242487 RepID=UPI003520F1D0
MPFVFQGITGLFLLALFAASASAPRTRTVQFGYKSMVGKLPPSTRTIDVWIPIPHDSPYQQITDLTISSPFPYQLDSAEYGNRLLHVKVNNPPDEGFAVDVQFRATRKEHRRPLTPVGLNANHPADEPVDPRWLQSDRLVPIDPTIRRWAKAVVDSVGATTDLEQARAIYNHVIATVKYDKTGTGWGRGDIYYACDARRGNCTDFHAIFIGYCRALGIPARFAIGFSLPPDRLGGQLSGYHCWAEFYSKSLGWIPIDASEAAKNPSRRTYFFGAHDENRIEFSRGRDLMLHPSQQQPLNYFVYPYAEADGIALTTVEQVITYRDLNK